jgi:hypothetical protein
MNIETARSRALEILLSDDYADTIKRQLADGTLPPEVHAGLWYVAMGGPPKQPKRILGVKPGKPRKPRRPRLTLVKTVGAATGTAEDSQLAEGGGTPRR